MREVGLWLMLFYLLLLLAIPHPRDVHQRYSLSDAPTPAGGIVVSQARLGSSAAETVAIIARRVCGSGPSILRAAAMTLFIQRGFCFIKGHLSVFVHNCVDAKRK